MRTCRYILLIILVIISVSCQSSPKNPLGGPGESKPCPTCSLPGTTARDLTPGSLLEESEAKLKPYPSESEGEQGAVSKTVSITSQPEKKKSPIKPVIVPVQTGILSPSTQEIPSGAPGAQQKEKQRIVLNFEKADIAEVTSQIF
ncbi:MAG TPA: hypothetical protein VEF34_13870, partial [Syntrophobacteraceae bacterium]|nr:hypothetical protein [Syntrophobacteraceae bacterium]